jgi:L-fucose mutarotase
MLKIRLAHPEILAVLGKAGHGSKVLIADGDYPVSTTGGKNCKVVHLNLASDVVNCTQVLEAILSVLLVEDAVVMDVPEGRDAPPIWDDYHQLLQENGWDFPIQKLERFAFYKEVGGDDVALIIQTGETRDYANILLTVGSL